MRSTTSTPMTLRAPGWYPDPENGAIGAERWWSGTEWSDSARSPEDLDRAPVPAEPPMPAVDAKRLAAARRDIVWAPLGLGVVGLIGVALIPLLHVLGTAFLAASVTSVVMGVRAVLLRRKGASIPLLPPVAGAVVGLVASALLLVAFAGYELSRLA